MARVLRTVLQATSTADRSGKSSGVDTERLHHTAGSIHGQRPCSFVSSQPQEDGLTKLVVAGPFRELDLGDQHWLNPVATFHDSRSNALTPAPGCFLRQVHERTRRTSDLLEASIQSLQGFFGKASADPSGEQ